VKKDVFGRVEDLRHAAGDQDSGQVKPQPGEQEAGVIAEGGEQCIEGIAGGMGER
jgi:hypothetical protein